MWHQFLRRRVVSQTWWRFGTAKRGTSRLRGKPWVFGILKNWNSRSQQSQWCRITWKFINAVKKILLDLLVILVVCEMSAIGSWRSQWQGFWYNGWWLNPCNSVSGMKVDDLIPPEMRREAFYNEITWRWFWSHRATNFKSLEHSIGWKSRNDHAPPSVRCTSLGPSRDASVRNWTLEWQLKSCLIYFI
jgi:hypothetical protein